MSSVLRAVCPILLLLAAARPVSAELMPADTTPLEFHVDDYDAAKTELESRGVEFVTETIDSGVCKQAIFQDPDGNALAIHHRYAPGTPPQAAGNAA